MAVAGELAGFAIMAQARLAGAAAVAGFSVLIVARIRIEERALHAEGAGATGPDTVG
jgi:isoprenylcysteine carboxyl methyltransferase (ICMT) family protein YpbQ